MEEVAAVVRAIAALNVVAEYRASPSVDAAIKESRASLNFAMADWISSETADAR